MLQREIPERVNLAAAAARAAGAIVLLTRRGRPCTPRYSGRSTT